jgi:hypothetical protein
VEKFQHLGLETRDLQHIFPLCIFPGVGSGRGKEEE